MKKLLLWLFMLIFYIPCMAQEKVSVLSIRPYFEKGQTKGYVMVTKQEKMASKVNYYIARCDLDMKPVSVITEQRVYTDLVADIAYNGKYFCIAFATDGNLQITVYDGALSAQRKRIVLEGQNKWEKMAASSADVVTYDESGFILNRYTVKDKQICDFIKYDNDLNKVWQYSSSFGFDDQHVTAFIYSTSTDQYFYNYVTRKKSSISANGANPSFIVNSSKDGSLVLNYSSSQPDLSYVDCPALLAEGSRDHALVAGEYINIKSKERGLLFADMDLKNKKSKERFLPFSAADFSGKVSAVYQTDMAKGKAGIHPYSVHHVGIKYIVVGEIYTGDTDKMLMYGLGVTEAKDLIVMEFDENLALLSIVQQPKKSITNPSTVKRGTGKWPTNQSILEVQNSDNGILIKYLDQVAPAKSADYCIVAYKDGKLTTLSRKAIAKYSEATKLNVWEGTNGKLNVMKETYQSLELVQQ